MRAGFLLSSILLFLALVSVHGRKFQWEDDDTIITEATREEDFANVIYERQDLTVPVKLLGQSDVQSRSINKRTCYSSLGDQGMCSTFKQCFPMLYYTDDEHMGEVKHPVLAELLMSTSGPCDPSPFSFRDDFPGASSGAYSPLAEDTTDMICCPNMKIPEPVVTKKPFIAKKATTTTTERSSTPSKPWVFVPDMMVGQMMAMEVMPPKKSNSGYGSMRPMGSESDNEDMKAPAVVVTPGKPAVEDVTAVADFSDSDPVDTSTVVLNEAEIETTTEFLPSDAADDLSPVVFISEIEEPTPPKLMNEPCGYLNSSRDPPQPWVAAIKLDSKYICTGSVIDSYHVLTAAHCIAHLSSLDVGRLRVYLGEKILNSNLDGPMVIRKVFRAMHHRGYSMSTLEDDIGLLKLNLPIPIKTNRVKPVCLPTEEENLEGEDALIVGWGPRWNDVPNDYLIENRFRVWSNGGCSKAYKHLQPEINITESMMCAQYYHVKPKEMSSYYDVDSGGSPVIVRNKDGTVVQVGVYSWRQSTSSALPYVLTKVSAFPKWIQKNRLRK